MDTQGKNNHSKNAGSESDTNFNNGEEPNKQADVPTPPAGFKPDAYNGQNDPRNTINGKFEESNEEVGRRKPYTEIPNNVTSDELFLLTSSKRLSFFAILGAILSVLIGGSLLSAVALICGIISYRKSKSYISAHADSQYSAYLKRRGILSIAVPAISLALNIVAIVVIMPSILQMMESGDYASLFGGSATNIAGSSSTWG